MRALSSSAYASCMRLSELTGLLDSWYAPAWAEPWDRVGLVCGDPDQEVRRILFAVDPVDRVVDEALDFGADLVVVHHPLLLTPVSSVAATDPKGRVVHRLLGGGVALFTAHTNADVPEHGVNDSLARALGLRDTRVLHPTGGAGLDKVVTFVPADAADGVRRALAEAGAGRIGAYDSCSFTSAGEGRFRPLDGADPAIGAVGRLEVVPEVRVEVVTPRERRAGVVRALRRGAPLRGAGVRRGRARRPAPPAHDRPPGDGPGARPGRQAGAADRPARVRRPGRGRAAGRPPTAYGWPVTPTGSSRPSGSARAAVSR